MLVDFELILSTAVIAFYHCPHVLTNKTKNPANLFDYHRHR